MNAKDFELYGVVHTPETIELYHQELEDAIHRSGAIVLEMAPDLRELRSDLESAHLNESVREEELRFLHFYEYLSTLAGSQNKLVINADPSQGGKGQELYQNIFLSKEKGRTGQKYKNFNLRKPSHRTYSVCSPQ